MRRQLMVTVAIAGGTAALASGGTLVASAASVPSPTPAVSGKAHQLGVLGRRLVAGTVVSDASSGGALGQGQLVIREPDGQEMTLSLAKQTRAWRYHGRGEGLTSESPGALAAGEVVVIRGRALRKQPVAGRILDLGLTAQS